MPRPTHRTSILSLATGLCGWLASEAAQAQTFAPAAIGSNRSTYSLEASYTAASDISQGSRTLGEIETYHESVAYTFSHQASERFSWDVGLSARRFDFDAPTRTVIPEELGSVSLRLGANWKLSDKWTASLGVQPGFYGDFENIRGDTFNAPATAGFFYFVNPDLQIIGGLIVNVRSEYPVFGGIGVRWRLATDWTLLLGAPRTRLEYGVNRNFTLFAGADLQGGAFRVAEDFGNTAGRPDLNNEDVDYREIRFGAGAGYRFNETFSVEAQAGWMIDRRFEFRERDLTLKSDGAPYVRVGVSGKF